jgi:hypothetical protein
VQRRLDAVGRASLLGGVAQRRDLLRLLGHGGGDGVEGIELRLDDGRRGRRAGRLEVVVRRDEVADRLLVLLEVLLGRLARLLGVGASSLRSARRVSTCALPCTLCRRTLSSSSCLAASALALASASALAFFSASDGPAAAPLGLPLFFLASRAAFSCCLNILMRGSRLRALSTSWRRRALSSFFLRARSVLFFFSM